MAADTLDRLLTALTVRLHAFSICEIQTGWRLTFPAFEAVTVHFVLMGSGVLNVGNGLALPFVPNSILVVPARQPHVVGDAGPAIQLIPAEDHCSMATDGLVTFTAGNGTRDILLLCGTVSATYRDALGLFDLLREPLVEDLSKGDVFGHLFALMLAEVANPALGTQAMTELLMKQCLIGFLRQRLLRDGVNSTLAVALTHRGLARAVLSIMEDPAAPHTVESLASLAGMSRASFAEHFSRAFQQGPIDFLQKVRLRVGARLLATTQLPLKVIAQSIGYAGSTPFARAFRTVYGADPLSYRSSGVHDEREPQYGLASDPNSPRPSDPEI